jgi:hypothetical protein
MGAVVAAVIGAVASSWASGYVIGYFALQGTWLAGAVRFGLGMIATMMSSSLFSTSEKKSDLGTTAQDRKLTLRSTQENRKRIYGTAMVSGPLALKTSTGSSNEYLHLVIAIAGRKVRSIGEVSFDSVLSTASRVSDYNRVKKHLGSALQEADADLVAEVPGWTTAHRGRGVAYVYTRQKYDSTAWPNGIKNVQAIAEGHALYDPRLATISIAASAAGTPAVLTTTAAHGLAVDDEVFVLGHADLAKRYFVASVPSATTLTLADAVSGAAVALAAASTGGVLSRMRWSNNWALCVLDYLLDPEGLDCGMDEIDADYWIAAANLSDEQVALGAVAAFTADPATDVITLAEAVPWQTGLQVRLSSTGNLPGGLAAAKSYAWVRLSPTTGQLAATKEDALYGLGVDITSAGSGAHSVSAALICGIDAAAPQQSATFTADASSDVLTLSADIAWTTGVRVRLSSSGTLPTARITVHHEPSSGGESAELGWDEIVEQALSAGTDYYLIRVSASTYRLASSAANATAGTAMDIVSAGSGAHTIANYVAAGAAHSGLVTLSDEVPRDSDSSDDSDQDEINPQFGWDTGDGVAFAGGTPPAGLALGVTYYWIRVTNTTGYLAASHEDAIAHAAMTLVDSGAGLALARVSQARYTCNGVLDLGNKPIDNLDKLLTAGGGYVPYIQGRYRLYGAGAQVPSFALTASDARDSVKVQARQAKRDIYNAVRGTFIDPTQLWQATDLPPLQSAVYQAQDGGQVIWKDLELPFTTDCIRGQRLLKIYLEDARQGMTVDFPARYTAGGASVFEIAPMCVGTLSMNLFGFTAKQFVCTSWKVADDLGIDLVLKEYAAAAFDWSPAEANHPDYAPNTALPSPGVVAAPTGLSLESGTAVLYVRADGTVQSRLRLAWTAPADRFVLSGGTIEIGYRRSSDAAWTRGGSVAGEATEAYILDVEDGVAYDVRIRAVNGIGAASAWVAGYNHMVLGKSEAPPAVDGVYLHGDSIYWTYGGQPVDFAGYRVRIAGGVTRTWEKGVDWPNADAVVTERSIPRSALGLATQTIMVKAQDSSGNLSDVARALTLNLGEYSPDNVIVTTDERALGWPGTITGGHVDADGDLACDDTGDAYLPDGASPYLPQPQAAYLPVSYGEMTYAWEYVPAAADVPGVAYLTTGIEGDGWNVQYRRRGTPETYLGHDDDAYLPDNSALYLGGPTPWTPFTGGIAMQRERLDLLLTIEAGVHAGKANALSVSIDVADIVESFENLVISSAGTRLPITKTYRSIDFLGSIALHDDGHGATGVAVLDKDPALGPKLAAVGASQATIDVYNMKGH